MSRRVRAYLAIISLAVRRTLAERAEVGGRVVFFVVVLGIFTSLWRAVAEAGLPLAAEPSALVWYLAVTEWIMLSAPAVHFDVQEAIRKGDVATQLTRPVSWVGATYCDAVGALFVRLPVLFVAAAVSATVFTGAMPPASVLRVVPLGVLSALLLTGLHLCIGILAFWLGDVAPVSWIWQKLLFVFGGLLMPLELYPSIVRTIAPWTPFPSVLSAPASMVIDVHRQVGPVAWVALGWSAVTALTATALFRMASARMTVNGG